MPFLSWAESLDWPCGNWPAHSPRNLGLFWDTVRNGSWDVLIQTGEQRREKKKDDRGLDLTIDATGLQGNLWRHVRRQPFAGGFAETSAQSAATTDGGQRAREGKPGSRLACLILIKHIGFMMPGQERPSEALSTICRGTVCRHARLSCR